MDALLEKLDTKLREWSPEKAERVRERVQEVIELADNDFTPVHSRIIADVAPKTVALNTTEADGKLDDLLDTLPPMPGLSDKALSRESIYASDDSH